MNDTGSYKKDEANAKQSVMWNVDLFIMQYFRPDRNKESSLGVYNDDTRLQRFSFE